MVAPLLKSSSFLVLLHPLGSDRPSNHAFDFDMTNELNEPGELCVRSRFTCPWVEA